MNRLFVLSFAVLLASAFVVNAGGGTAISVAGQLNGGNNVSATCLVKGPGQVSGAGSLSGTNPANGYKYSYPFTVTGVTTAPGKVILTGKLVNAPTVPVTLTAAVPTGAVTFTYVINGKTVTYTGTGKVTIQ